MAIPVAAARQGVGIDNGLCLCVGIILGIGFMAGLKIWSDHNTTRDRAIYSCIEDGMITVEAQLRGGGTQYVCLRPR